MSWVRHPWGIADTHGALQILEMTDAMKSFESKKLHSWWVLPSLCMQAGTRTSLKMTLLRVHSREGVVTHTKAARILFTISSTDLSITWKMTSKMLSNYQCMISHSDEYTLEWIKFCFFVVVAFLCFFLTASSRLVAVRKQHTELSEEVCFTFFCFIHLLSWF